jgi:Zn-finger nucleic acid-binding protein
MCRADLIRTPYGDVEAWVCPTGHGLALAPSEAHGAEDALEEVWERAEAAALGIRHCPRCEGEMAVVSLDDPEPVKADVCPTCQVLWFDSLEFAGLPVDQPDPQALVTVAVDRAAIAELLQRTPSHA